MICLLALSYGANVLDNYRSRARIDQDCGQVTDNVFPLHLLVDANSVDEFRVTMFIVKNEDLLRIE